jgi:extradiol dioxygenase family protein
MNTYPTDCPPFHLAFLVNDISVTESFYSDILGCDVGRSDKTWIDFNLFGNQIVAHLTNQPIQQVQSGTVDGITVPVPHFGILLNKKNFIELESRIIKNNIQFVVSPRTRFTGKHGEQRVMFILDPSGNALEFKNFKNKAGVFASN